MTKSRRADEISRGYQVARKKSWRRQGGGGLGGMGDQSRK